MNQEAVSCVEPARGPLASTEPQTPIEGEPQTSEKEKEIEFAFSEEVAPVTMKKIKIESQKDIEDEIDKLTKEFTEKSKK